MRVNMKHYPNPDESSNLLPEGKYLCEAKNIRTGQFTRDGDERWNVQLVVAQGLYTGKWIWDNWIFNSANPILQKRQVLILHRVGGFEKDYEGEVIPEDFYGREFWVVVEHQEYKDKTQARVAFDGYQAYSEDSKPPEEQTEPVPDIEEESIPF